MSGGVIFTQSLAVRKHYANNTPLSKWTAISVHSDFRHSRGISGQGRVTILSELYLLKIGVIPLMICDFSAVVNIAPYEHSSASDDSRILDCSTQSYLKNFLSSSKLNRQDRFERIATMFEERKWLVFQSAAKQHINCQVEFYFLDLYKNITLISSI